MSSDRNHSHGADRSANEMREALTSIQPGVVEVDAAWERHLAQIRRGRKVRRLRAAPHAPGLSHTRVILFAAGVIALAAAVAFGSVAIVHSTSGGVRPTHHPTTQVTVPKKTTVPSTTPIPKTAVSTPAAGSGAPSPTLVYTGPGVAIVGMGPPASEELTKPSSLYLSTDLTHWKDVTPPQSRVGQDGTFPIFQHASFLNAEVGWVTAFNPIEVNVTIYRTSDGGNTWSSIPGGYERFADGDVLIQLLTPTTAFRETITLPAPSMSLDETTNAGVTWHTVYGGPSGVPAGGQLQGPFALPLVFVDSDHGFGSVGDPPVENRGSWGSCFYYTTDGGSSWTSESPPLPTSRPACSVSSSSLFGSPYFSDADSGVVPGISISGDRATVDFDTTSDEGLHWEVRSQQSVPVVPNTALGSALTLGYPLESIASSSTWWLLGWSSTGLTTQVTADAGAHWTQAAGFPIHGIPAALATMNASDAILTLQDTNGSRVVLVTLDGGNSWKPLVPEG